MIGGISKTDQITKTTFCQDKNGLPGISLVSTILALSRLMKLTANGIRHPNDFILKVKVPAVVAH